MWAESTPKGGVKERRISSIYALIFETKSILSDRACVDLESLSILICVFLCFGYKITKKPRNPSDNLVHTSTLQRLSELSTIKIHKDRRGVFIRFLIKGGQRLVDYLMATPLVIGATG